MLISFIIIAYNAEKTLNGLFQNLFEQDYEHQNMELILVDSASTDSTAIMMQNFCKGFGPEFKRVCLLKNPKRTLPCGWNIALGEARGDVVIRVDAHAVLPGNFISLSVKCLLEHNEDICGGRVISIADEDKPWQKILLQTENSSFGCGIARFRQGETRDYVNTLAYAAYKRKVFETVGLFDERLDRTEDNEMHYRMRQAGYRFFFDPQIQSYRKSRNTLKKLIAQKYLNGFWIGLTLGVSPKCFSLYHFVPFAFLICIILSGILALLGIPQPAWIIWGGYLGAAVPAAVLCRETKRLSFSVFAVPLIFLLLHLSYGMGTLAGVLGMPAWKKKHAQSGNCPEPARDIKEIL
jgi:glycosyltransferase involved in cell wall biosynthesis